MEDLGSFGTEDFVETVDELAASVTNEGPCTGESIAVAEERVAGRLGGPGTSGVGGDAGEEDLAGVDVDEEQEVTGNGSLGVQEL